MSCSTFAIIFPLYHYHNDDFSVPVHFHRTNEITTSGVSKSMKDSDKNEIGHCCTKLVVLVTIIQVRSRGYGNS